MKRTVILCVIGAVISMMAAKAQNVETIYYDGDGQIVKVKEFADYYRIIESGNSFPKMFRDYYCSGEKFRTGGKVVDINGDGSFVIEGNIKQYYKNGNLQIECQYVNGKLNGLYTEYHEDGGRYERTYEDGVPTEEWGCLYDSKGNMSRVDDNGNPYHKALQESDRYNVLSGGQLWQSYSDGSFSVAAQLHPIREYGKYYRLDIFIGNGSMETIDFDPAVVKMYQNDKNGKRTSVRSVSGNEFKNKIDRRHRSKGFWYAVAQGVAAGYAGSSSAVTATNNGTVAVTSQYSNANALYAQQIANQNVQSYENALAEEMSVLSDNYLVADDLNPGFYLSGFVLFDNNSSEEAEVVIPVNGQDFVFRFSDLENKESGSWAPIKDASKVGFSLALAPMVSRYLDEGGSRAEISAYEASMISNLNSMQSDLTFDNKDAKYSIVIEVVSADEDDAELRGWAYLYDNATLEKLASSKIRAEGGRGSTFNLRLEKSLRKAAKNLLTVIHSK